MSKDQRGTKRECDSCGKKFYDLGRDPIVCPYCDTQLVFEKPKPKAEAKPEASEPEKAEETAEAEKPAAAAAATAAADPEPEFVSLDEAAEEEEEMGDDAQLPDLGDDEEDIPPNDAEDVFLEEDEEDPESDVTGIIGGPIDPKDEA